MKKVNAKEQRGNSRKSKILKNVEKKLMNEEG